MAPSKHVPSSKPKDVAIKFIPPYKSSIGIHPRRRVFSDKDKSHPTSIQVIAKKIVSKPGCSTPKQTINSNSKPRKSPKTPMKRTGSMTQVRKLPQRILPPRKCKQTNFANTGKILRSGKIPRSGKMMPRSAKQQVQNALRVRQGTTRLMIANKVDTKVSKILAKVNLEDLEMARMFGKFRAYSGVSEVQMKRVIRLVSTMQKLVKALFWKGLRRKAMGNELSAEDKK
uniref:Uncharacterized protein n=1 Tax=Strigamia maritima TaxID=126957 RepID=T1JEL6_STRMM